jgi:hypothetical protein
MAIRIRRVVGEIRTGFFLALERHPFTDLFELAESAHRVLG